MLKKLFHYDVEWKMLVKIFVILVGIGCLLMVLVYCIPEDRIRMNIIKSVGYMNEEKCYPYMGIKDGGYVLDNYTEASLLNFMYTAEHTHPIYSAFVHREYFPKVWYTGIDCLTGLVEEWPDNMTGEMSIRSVYWIGYSIFLRPLLYFTDYYNIRSINNIVAMVTLVAMCIFIAKKLNNYVAIAFAATLSFFNYYVLSLNITLGIFCVYVMYVILAYILDKEGQVNYGYTMLTAGVLTAFFEWFSIPYITFGIPVLILIYYERERKKANFVTYFNIVFQSGVSWCLGYGGMIVFKPILAGVVSGQSALGSFAQRVVANNTEDINSFMEFMVALKRLFRLMFPIHLFDDVYNIHRIYIAIAVFIIILFGLVLYIKELHYQLINLLIAVSPIAWYFVFKGHMNHLGIDFRTFMVTVFAMLLMLEKPLKELCQWIIKYTTRLENKG